MLDQVMLWGVDADDEPVLDLAPPVTEGAAGPAGPWVAFRIGRGEGLMDILGDEELREDFESHPDMLSAMARDAAVRAALESAPVPAGTAA